MIKKCGCIWSIDVSSIGGHEIPETFVLTGTQLLPLNSYACEI